MCCRTFLKRVVPFFIAFLFALYISSLVASVNSSRQQIKNKVNYIEQKQERNCVRVENQINEIQKQLLGYEAQKVEVLNWLETNKDASLKEKQLRQNKLYLLNKSIERIKVQIDIYSDNLSTQKHELTTNLLLVEKYYCYDF